MLHFILVFTVYQSTHLGVLGLQVGVNKVCVILTVCTIYFIHIMKQDP